MSELHLQHYLRSGKNPAELQEKFGVNNYEHPELPLVGFKYGLIESKRLKFHPIVRESRGIVLERDTWEIVAYPFQRFFNLGDDKVTEDNFDWKNFTSFEKKDGSLIIVYYYDNQWRVNTSGSFAQGLCYESNLSWEELFWKTSGIDKNKLIKTCTYIFELFTKWNKIVCTYDSETVSLIGMRENFGNYTEIGDQDFLNWLAKDIKVSRPEVYDLHREEIQDFIYKKNLEGPIFEGLVLCDNNFNRIKIKSDRYLENHRMAGNGQFIPKNFIPDLLRGNFKQLSIDFSQWLEELEYYVEEIDRLKLETDNIWFTYQVVKDRKKFAQHVMKEATLPSILFQLHDGKYSSVEDAFSQSEALLIKYFERKK